MIVSPEDGWQGTAAPRGSAANNKCQVDQEEDLTKKYKDLGLVYILSDPLICAQFYTINHVYFYE